MPHLPLIKKPTCSTKDNLAVYG